MLVLIGNGVHPIINNGRPADFDVLIFTWMMAAWECAFSILFLFIEKRSGQLHYLTRQGGANTGNFKVTTFRLVIIGLIFTVATYYYVLGLSLAGSISGSIALKTSPIYAMLIGSIFLNEKTSKSSIFLTAFMLLGLYYMATAGTFLFGDFNRGVGMLLLVPLLWGIGHAIGRVLLKNGLASTVEIIFVRTAIVFGIIFGISLRVNGWNQILRLLTSPVHLFFGAAMGIMYFFMHYGWYKSITTIDLGFASALVIPSPAITVILAIWISKEPLYSYQIIGMLVMFVGLYAMLYIQFRGKKERRKKTS
jgi:drug/metabolite transporter (DMT)-like permease